MKMQVFVLVGAEQYEGESVIGVYASLVEAQVAAHYYQDRALDDDRSEGYCAAADWYAVYEVEVGRAGRWYNEEDYVWSLEGQQG